MARPSQPESPLHSPTPFLFCAPIPSWLQTPLGQTPPPKTSSGKPTKLTIKYSSFFPQQPPLGPTRDRSAFLPFSRKVGTARARRGWGFPPSPFLFFSSVPPWPSPLLFPVLSSAQTPARAFFVLPPALAVPANFPSELLLRAVLFSFAVAVCACGCLCVFF